MWRGWWNDGDSDVGLYNEVDSRQNCRSWISPIGAGGMG